MAHYFQLQIDRICEVFSLFKKTTTTKRKAQVETWSNGLKHFSINAVTNGKFLNRCCNTSYFFIKKEETDTSQPYVTTPVLSFLLILYVKLTLQPRCSFKSKVCFCWKKQLSLRCWLVLLMLSDNADTSNRASLKNADLL